MVNVTRKEVGVQSQGLDSVVGEDNYPSFSG